MAGLSRSRAASPLPSTMPGAGVDAEPAHDAADAGRRPGEGRRLPGRTGHLPGQALGDDVVGLHEHLRDQLAYRRRLHACRAPCGRRRACRGRPAGPGARAAAASSCPASRSGWRCGSSRAGRARPPSVITAVIGGAVVAGHVLGAPRTARSPAPAKALSSTTMRVGVTCARVHRGGQVGQPGGAGVGGRDAGRGAGQGRVAAADQHDRAAGAGRDAGGDAVGRRVHAQDRGRGEQLGGRGRAPPAPCRRGRAARRRSSRRRPRRGSPGRGRRPAAAPRSAAARRPASRPGAAEDAGGAAACGWPRRAAGRRVAGSGVRGGDRRCARRRSRRSRAAPAADGDDARSSADPAPPSARGEPSRCVRLASNRERKGAAPWSSTS